MYGVVRCGVGGSFLRSKEEVGMSQGEVSVKFLLGYVKKDWAFGLDFCKLPKNPQKILKTIP